MLLGLGARGYRYSYNQLRGSRKGMLSYAPENKTNQGLLKMVFYFKEG